MPRGERLLIKRTFQSLRKHTATIHFYLDDLQKKFIQVHPDIAEALNVADQLDAQLDILIQKIDEQI